MNPDPKLQPLNCHVQNTYWDKRLVVSKSNVIKKLSTGWTFVPGNKSELEEVWKENCMTSEMVCSSPGLPISKYGSNKPHTQILPDWLGESHTRITQVPLWLLRVGGYSAATSCPLASVTVASEYPYSTLPTCSGHSGTAWYEPVGGM